MDESSRARPKPMPTVFLPHGGGPWPWVSNLQASHASLAGYLQRLPTLLPETPRAIVVISAHWEESVPTVMTSSRPSLLYDYYGFPESTYAVTWPAPGAPGVAAEVVDALAAAGLPSATDAARGFDHGTFVPLSLAFPHADIPTVQLSLQSNLDPATHLKVGTALGPLRDRGVLIIGSGMSYHNLREFFAHLGGAPGPRDDSRAFDDWLSETMALPANVREQRLRRWYDAPAARACHPREEHLLPLHVAVGAAGESIADMPFRGLVMGAHVSAVHFA